MNNKLNCLNKTEACSLRFFTLLFSFLFSVLINTSAKAAKAVPDWNDVPEILSKIKAPQFPDKDFNIIDFGAIGDGNTVCTDSFKKAIDAASQAGGGRVIVPAGTFFTGPIHIKSNINLYVSEGAIINFSIESKAYMPVVLTRFESVEIMNLSPLIYAYEQENIAITGKGTLDGQASNQNWWGRSRAQGNNINLSRQMGENGVPVKERIFGVDRELRPNMVQPYKCKNVLIEGVTFKNSPMWHLNPVLCENVTIRNVKVIGHGPNNDGCDPESCKNVLIEGCYFDTGDDCIAIKSGRNNDGRRVNVPSENIIIRNCEMKDGHGGVVIGSEMTGGVRNVFAEDCNMDSPNLDRVLRIKTNSVRGGTVENIYMRNVTVGQVAESVLRINFFYGEGDTGQFTPTVRNINMENVTCQKSRFALSIRGYERSPITNVTLKNCTFDNVERASEVEGIINLTFDNVKINGEIQKE